MDFWRCGREATASDSSNKSRAPKMARCASGKEHAIGDVSLGERGGEHFAGEVTGLVGVTFAAAGAASQAKRDVVFGEDVGEALDFAGVGNGKQYLVALSGELLHFFEHGRNRAMEAGSGLGEESDG